MQSFYIGQTVRYLNQKGEGVITKITSHSILVEDSSGFEIPYQAKELVPADSKELHHTERASSVSSSSHVETPVSRSAPKKFLSEGVYLLLINLQEKGFEWMLVNESDFSISMNVYVQEQTNFIFQKSIQASARQSLLLTAVKKDDIGWWQQVAVQILFAKPSLTKLPEMYAAVKKLDGKKIFQDTQYVQTKYHHLPVYDICLWSPEMKESDVVIHEEMLQQFFQRDKSEAKKSLPHAVEEELIIDLHIEELIENFTTYTPSTLLQIQVNKIKSEIEKAYAKNRRQLIFIHGVGKGVLKKEMTNVLKTYPHVRYYDAPYNKFGFGATVVELH
jgi:hypothetical protein